MSITDELREWYKDRFFMANGWQEINDIADRIDAEHEAKVSYWQGACYRDGYDEGFASADDWLAQHEDAMAEHGWVKLPVDADGECIHVGDAVTCGATVWTVTGLKFLGEGWGICCTVYNEYGGSGTSVYPPSDLHHYHEPTVEDVLREFAEKVTDSQVPGVRPTYEEAISEFASRLRLAEEGE